MDLPKTEVAVKICGITRAEDAHAAIEAGADLLGFNTWTGTKRHIDLDKNAEWLAALPILKIALLVNATPTELRKVAQFPWIDALQLHGDEDAAYCRAAAALGKPIIKALRASTSLSLRGADQFSTNHLLLDASVAGEYGGTGTRVNMELVREFAELHPRLTLWLAGGLRPENVAAAIREGRPRVVDVSSGVEGKDGRKDATKMRDFLAAAKAR
jgi:phosphoribosylanthranilate isomerase